MDGSPPPIMAPIAANGEFMSADARGDEDAWNVDGGL